MRDFVSSMSVTSSLFPLSLHSWYLNRTANTLVKSQIVIAMLLMVAVLMGLLINLVIFSSMGGAEKTESTDS